MRVSYTERHPGVTLPTLPDLAHGIVSRMPYEVQCDGCLVVRSGSSKSAGAQIILAGILFNPRRPADKRRLCRECRETHWNDSDRKAS